MNNGHRLLALILSGMSFGGGGSVLGLALNCIHVQKLCFPTTLQISILDVLTCLTALERSELERNRSYLIFLTSSIATTALFVDNNIIFALFSSSRIERKLYILVIKEGRTLTLHWLTVLVQVDLDDT